MCEGSKGSLRRGTKLEVVISSPDFSDIRGAERFSAAVIFFFLVVTFPAIARHTETLFPVKVKCFQCRLDKARQKSLNSWLVCRTSGGFPKIRRTKSSDLRQAADEFSEYKIIMLIEPRRIPHSTVSSQRCRALFFILAAGS